MKLVERNLDKDGEGHIVLIPEEPEDMWHAYNLISEGDSVRSTTIRKVQTESSTGSSSSNRVRTTLTISVENIDFDTQACMLRLKGRNIEENQYVKMGAYHTLDLELNRKFSLRKQVWDSISLERIDTACDPTKSADVAAVIMQEGLAHVCLITPSMTLIRAKIDVSIPRKRKGFVQQHEKGLNKFYDNVMQAILRHVNFDIVKCILVASPGFVRDQFYEYMFQTAVKTDNKLLLENKSKFMLVHASSGFKHSLKEVLQDPAVMAKISDTKAAGEVKALETFYTMLQCEPARAFYGKKHIEKANEAQAIETLLISDNLFRANFTGPSIQQITPPVDHAEGPTWDGRKNILYFVDIHYGGVLAYHYDTNKLTRVTLNGEVTPVVPSRKDPNILLVGLNRSVVAIEWDGNLELGGQQVLATVAKDHPTSRFNDGKADKQGRLWWGTIGYESPSGELNMYEAYFYKITKDNLDNPTVVKSPVSNSNGLAWNKANNKLYYIDTPTRKIVEFVYDDDLGVLSKENRTAFDVDLYPGKITGYPDGMTIDEDDNLWICLYGGGAVIKANPTTGELLKVVPIPARDVTSAMWGGPDLDVLFVTTSRHSLSDTEKLQQPGAGSVYAITNLGTKGLAVFTADIIDSIAKRRNILDNIFNAEIFAPLAPRETSNNIVYPQNNEIPLWRTIMKTIRSFF